MNSEFCQLPAGLWLGWTHRKSSKLPKPPKPTVNYQLTYQRNISVSFEVVAVHVFVFNAINVHTGDSILAVDGSVPADGGFVTAED